jgi:hypothetical protein
MGREYFVGRILTGLGSSIGWFGQSILFMGYTSLTDAIERMVECTYPGCLGTDTCRWSADTCSGIDTRRGGFLAA